MSLTEKIGETLEREYFDTIDERKMLEHKEEMIAVSEAGLHFDVKRGPLRYDVRAFEKMVDQLKTVQESEASHEYPTGYLSSEIVDQLKKGRLWKAQENIPSKVHFFTAVSPRSDLRLPIDAKEGVDGLLVVYGPTNPATGKPRIMMVKIDLTANPSKFDTKSDVLIKVLPDTRRRLKPTSPHSADSALWKQFSDEVASGLAAYIEERWTNSSPRERAFTMTF